VKGVRDLVDGETTVVSADLDVHSGLEHLLTEEEMARARRFHRRIHRDRFVAARGLLRLLLGERLDAEPTSIRIMTEEHGKPRLDDGPSLGFNLAHSGGDALYAFITKGDVGVDIERVRPVDPVGLSRTCFSKVEREQLLDMDASKRLDAFFHGWARKEAVIKADGRGMSLELDSFSVSLTGAARLVEPPPGDDPQRWSLTSLDAGPAVRAAVAVRS
jgi:4'-phosphopantetheinyl transferase